MNLKDLNQKYSETYQLKINSVRRLKLQRRFIDAIELHSKAKQLSINVLSILFGIIIFNYIVC